MEKRMTTPTAMITENGSFEMMESIYSLKMSVRLGGAATDALVLIQHDESWRAVQRKKRF